MPAFMGRALGLRALDAGSRDDRGKRSYQMPAGLGAVVSLVRNRDEAGAEARVPRRAPVDIRRPRRGVAP